MPYELNHVKLSDIDLERGSISIHSFKSHSSSIFMLPNQMLALLKEYAALYNLDFPLPPSEYICKAWQKYMKVVADKLQD